MTTIMLAHAIRATDTDIQQWHGDLLALLGTEPGVKLPVKIRTGRELWDAYSKDAGGFNGWIPRIATGSDHFGRPIVDGIAIPLYTGEGFGKATAELARQALAVDKPVWSFGTLPGGLASITRATHVFAYDSKDFQTGWRLGHSPLTAPGATPGPLTW